ncbi:arabinogalactan endo-1,4-beta-galactosidase [Paenibacillus cellulosilyticus]|uniref:Arabinogalactan endo-beta-1,4-galactanase n=1 Tax=Paenibacillus cellulosilyticus TaxID=375489 RepID=A0A2V2YV34_9BACL|nr:glycosyl hydrolase 53 family protein [Paenibacillus cellulosilyticus]PWW05087.1 arabinogalactan endo-1,4-beta-galactosidase [Paenibacillus cellulosilyticus]QKS48639.1 glycosyl hydrolase 53 family protein [Paenibacillus cellulosilyticus]
MNRIYYKGADVSMLKEVETLGGKFMLDDEQKDLFEILRINGFNVVRLRLWVNPYDEEGQPYMGGTNDLETTIELAKRAKLQGLQFMLNIHYSDFWADPKKQSKPKAWQSLSFEQLEEQVYRYTKEVLNVCRACDVLPDLVQVGNETTNGMLWPEGRTPKYHFEEKRFEPSEEDEWKASFDRLAALLRAGTRAVREVGPMQIILHLDAGGSNVLYRTWFDEMQARGVDYDIIGLSYYPIWHGTLEELRFNLNDISARYGKEVLVVETAYGYTADSPSGADIFTEDLAKAGGYSPTVEGQAQFLHDLMTTVREVPNGRGRGIVYWEPAWLPVNGTTWASPEGMKYGNDVASTGNHWSNQALFDFTGKALASLRVFQQF